MPGEGKIADSLDGVIRRFGSQAHPLLSEENSADMTDTVNKQILRETANYLVTYYPAPPKVLVIVFISAGRAAPGEPIEEFKRTLERFGCAVIFVLDKKTLWYNYSETPAMLREIEAITVGYDKVVALGESMGGCGAIMASNAMPNLDRVMAFSPQYSIAPPFINFDARYEPVGRSIGDHRYWHFAKSLNPDRCTLLFGNLDWYDYIQSAMFEAHGFSTLCISGAPHNVAAFLKETPGNGLARLIGAFLDFDKQFDKSAIEDLLPKTLTTLRLMPGYGLEDDIRQAHQDVSQKISAQLAARYKAETGLTLGPNLALGKWATQSSTTLWSRELDPEQDAAGAVNGRINGFYSFHTEADTSGPWWMVDLGAMYEIMEVRAFNYLASAGVADRIRQLAILLSQDGTSWTVGYRHNGEPSFGGADGHPLIWRPDAVRAARFVRMHLEVANYLHLDEVQVFGRPLLERYDLT